MTNQHPITPPPELVCEWKEQASLYGNTTAVIQAIARWGADQELEACVEWLASEGYSFALSRIRDARRPKLPSLKEQALRVLVENGTNLDGRMELDSADIEIISRALEALPE